MPPSRSILDDVSQSSNLIALQKAIADILPSSTTSDAVSKLAAASYRASQLSVSAMHPETRCKDEIWHLLRAAGTNPSDLALEQIFERVYQLHKSITRELTNLRLDRYDDRLSLWNDTATAFFEQMALTAGVGKRVHEQRQSSSSDHPTSSSTFPSSSSNLAATASSATSSQPSFEPSWLRLRCAKLQIVREGNLPAHEMAASVLSLLADTAVSDDQIQGDLFDAFAADFEAVVDVLSRRVQIRANVDAILADCSQAHELSTQGVSLADAQRGRGVRGRNSRSDRTPQTLGTQITVHDSRQRSRQKKQAREMRRLVKAGLIMEEEPDEEDDFAVQDLGGSQFEERARAFGTETDRDVGIGTIEKITLPRGSTREVGKGFEEIFVPPPVREPFSEDDLVDISTALNGHPELLRAMRGVKRLNRLQSMVYPVAFKSNENLLVCAPTGAGKTNVALLTIFREIVAVKTREQLNFKVVYVAPMKALAAEVTEKFHQRLGPLGLRVREFTGDMSLSRVEALETHILVTTPEKWDVVTRKSGSELGDMVTLFIVDEIHLLHDERGAVLESIVARTLRLSETAQKRIRLVGLSATLPNYTDVGEFMRVNPSKGLFHFDGSHRPVPLSQTFIGVSEGTNSNSSEARRRRDAKMHELAWKKVKDSLQRGHQAMIFVHSRKGTTNAAREMISRATQDDLENIFLGGEKDEKNEAVDNSTELNGEDENNESLMPSWATREIAKSRTADIRELCTKGVGVHNAGLPRPDRKLVEKLFAEGVIRLLCCTATLAWGVNLPARTVVILGTEVYNAEKGGFVQLGILDVQQIFGRAGRPQFDTEGEGTIITEHDHLAKYLSLLTNSVPIESQLGASASRLADHLNAEIVSGTVSSIGDGVRWLNYTYLRVRMPQNPLVYGMEWAEVDTDPGLHSRKAALIEEAAKALDDARMCRYDPRTGMLSPSDLGRVSSHYYVSHETVVLWNELLASLDIGPAVSDKDKMRMYSIVLHAVSCATEFEQMRSRQEEADELDILTRKFCPVPLKCGSETREGKVAILLQAHISRATVRMSDLSYIVQSATRLLRALFEIALRRGLPGFSLAALELARASESSIWPFQHSLWQFTYLSRRDKNLLVNPETIANIESGGEKHDLQALRSMTKEELSVLIRSPKMAQTVVKVLKSIPTLEIVKSRVAPLGRSLLSVEISLCASFTWHDALHGRVEHWWLWIEDLEEDRIYHSQKILLTKKQVQSLNEEVYTGDGERSRRTLDFKFTVAVFDPPSAQYWVRVESDRWHTGGGSQAVLSVASLQLPTESKLKSEHLQTPPASVMSSLPPQEAALFNNFSRFTPIQTQILKLARHAYDNILVSAPSGSGKMAIAELGILNAFQNKRDSVVVFITSEEGTLELMRKQWRNLSELGEGSLRVVNEHNASSGVGVLKGACLILATSASWNAVMNVSHFKEVFKKVSLFVFHDINLISHPSNVGMELLVSHLRRSRQRSGGDNPMEEPINVPRIIALGSALPNAAQVADWLGVSRQKGLFSFGQEARQVPCESHVISVAGDRYTSRMHSMNLPLYSSIQRYSVKKPVLIYVSSKRQTLLTCQDLLRLASLEGKSDMFVLKDSKSSRSPSLSLRSINDRGLRQAIPKGIGLYHAGLTPAERNAVEQMFQSGELHVVIATFDVARSLNVQAHQVILKGTEVFDGKSRRFEDLPVADVEFMIGQAGRVGENKNCYAVVFVHEPRQTLFKKLLHEPLPVESSLLQNDIAEILLGEIVSDRITQKEDIMDWLLNTFFFKRLTTNPGYYGLKKKSGMYKKAKGMSNSALKVMEAELRTKFCEDLIAKAVEKLRTSACVDVGTSVDKNSTELRATRLGVICSRTRILAVSTRLIFDGSNECQSVEDVVDLICKTPEITDMSQEYDEETLWVKLFERVVKQFTLIGKYSNVELAAKGLKITGWMDSAQKRAKILCLSFMVDETSRVEEVSMSRVKAYESIRRMLFAGAQVCAERGSLQAVKEIIKAGQCVCQGCPPTDNFWDVSGFNNSVVSQKGCNVGFVSMQDVLNRGREFAVFLAKNCAESERGAIMQWISSYPQMEQVVVERSDGGRVMVKMRGQNLSNVPKVVDLGSRMSGPIQAGWMVVVWSELTGKVMGGVRVTEREHCSVDDDGVSWLCVEIAIRGGDASRARVWIGSDSWIGAEAEGGMEGLV